MLLPQKAYMHKGLFLFSIFSYIYVFNSEFYTKIKFCGSFFSKKPALL